MHWVGLEQTLSEQTFYEAFSVTVTKRVQNKKKKYRLRQLEVCVCFGLGVLFQPILEWYIQMGQTPRWLSANAVTGAFEQTY